MFDANRSMRLLLGLLPAVVALPAAAVDGVILIDQNKAMAGNVSPGDSAGFPVSINRSGSYRLAGNLTVPNNTTNAIEINASDVTLDLNGFAIVGPVDCSAGFPCQNAGSIASGYGIIAGSDAPEKAWTNITVRNGTVKGTGADGIKILGDQVRIEDMRIHDTGLSGIVVRGPGARQQRNAIIRGNTVERAGSYGIKVAGGLVTDNSITACADAAIQVAAGPGTVARNVAVACEDYGLLLFGQVGYSANTLSGNGVAPVLGGINLGQNLCDAAACPGASF
jgi:hypothetical protein